ncbi:MAG: tetratricopeptide repeat protein [Deltaproteobacteria bacterium]|nr:tetratricopeptide repeat protein [Deltaproteobacteria bacterium]
MTGSKGFPMWALVAVVAAVLVSGAAGLAYEVVWSRMLVIPLGNSTDANALVLAAFMLGIAVGARLLGGLADRVQSPLKLYAALELLLGIFGIAMPFFIGAVGSAEVLRGSYADSPMTAIGRLTVAGLLVAIPSVAMGATLPVIIRAISVEVRDVRRRVGLVYGVNTLGAACGASLAGFVAIPTIGLALTSIGFACLSIGAAVIAIVVNMRVDSAKSSAPSEASDVLSSRRIATCALVGAAVSGFIMLAAEVLWARILTFVFGHDTYAFAVLLAVVLLGLGVGGFVHKKLAGRNPVIVLGLLVSLTSMALLDSFWMAGALVVEVGRDPFGLGAMGDLSSSLRLEFYREILFAPILVFIPSVLAGTAFPAACALYTGSVARAGSRVGTVTLVNGIASALGALLTSFALVALIGIQGAFFALAALGSVASIVILYLGGGFKEPRRIVILVAPIMATILVAIVMPSSLPRAMLQEAVGERHQRILHYEEGRTGTVSVTENTINGEKQLFMNAVNEVTTRLVHDQSFKLLGHLGPLLHPKPKNGLMICLGAGLSAGAALVHPLAKLDVVELSSTVPNATKLWKKENNNVLEDSRFKLHVADGRHFLAGTDEHYDVVMVDSTHPKAVDSWILYTKEFYELVRERLEDDGIAVQWVPLHGLSEQEFKVIVRTFLHVFPEMTLWVNVGFEVYGQAAYVKMVGTKEPLLIDYREFAMRLKEPRIERDLKPFGMAKPEELLDSFLAGPLAVNTWTQGLPIQTDIHPIVPYTTMLSAGRRMTAPLLLGVRSSVMPLLRRMGEGEAAIRKKLEMAREAQGFLLAGLLDRATETWPDGEKIGLFKKRAALGRDYYLALGEIYAEDAEKLFEIGNYLGNLGHVEEARRQYEKAIDIDDDDSRYKINLALVLLDLNENARAKEMLVEIVRAEPGNALAHYNLGVALSSSDNPKNARPHLEQAIQIAPDLIGARVARAQVLFDLGELNAAESELGEVVERNRWVAEAWDMLGLIETRRRDFGKAKNHHIRALSLEPYRASSHYNLGIALQESGQLKEAAAAYLAALRIDPRDAEAHNNLGLVYAGAGLYEQAAEAHRNAIDIEPRYAEAAYNLGLSYKALGRQLAAAEAFGLALKIAPGLTPAEQQLKDLGLERVEINVDLLDSGVAD